MADTRCTQALADRMGLYVQAYTLYSSVRPFGISAILGAVDKDGPALYVVEPSGVYYVRESFFSLSLVRLSSVFAARATTVQP